MYRYFFIVILACSFNLSLLAKSKSAPPTKITRPIYREDRKGSCNFYDNFIHILPLSYSEEEIIRLLKSHPHPQLVQNLSIGYGYVVLGTQVLTENLFQFISDHFPHLEKLDLVGCQFDLESLKKKSLSFPLLKYLSIAMLPSEYLDESSEILSQSMPELVVLTVDGNFTDRAITSFCLSCPKLRGIYAERYYIDLSPYSTYYHNYTLSTPTLQAMIEHGKNLSNVLLLDTAFCWEEIKLFLITHPGIALLLRNNLEEIPLQAALELASSHPFILKWCTSKGDCYQVPIPIPYHDDD